MIENNGDLISREALRETLKSICKPELCGDYGKDYCRICCPHNDFEDLIDNAPTIDTDEIYKKGYHAGFFATHGEPERPQGKWLFDTQNTALGTFGVRNNICSECRHITKYKYPFCPWCGAEMERQFYE